MSDNAAEDRRSRPRPRLTQWLFDPFTYIAGEPALALGLVAIVATGIIGAVSGAHVDGVLDLHIGPSPAIWVVPVEGIIDWLCLAIVLFITGRLASRTAFRAIDLFGTQALAHAPMLIAISACAAPPFRRYLGAVITHLISSGAAAPPSAADGVVFMLVVVVTVAAIVWMVALMYRSYALCCNLRGARAAATFVIGLLVAEVLSKLAMWPLLKP